MCEFSDSYSVGSLEGQHSSPSKRSGIDPLGVALAAPANSVDLPMPQVKTLKKHPREWPWSIAVVLVNLLLDKARISSISPELATQILCAESDAIEACGTRDAIESLKIDRRLRRSAKVFLEYVRHLTPSERLDCCWSSGLGEPQPPSFRGIPFATVEDRPVLSPDPLGHLFNAFAMIDASVLPLPKDIHILAFVPCPAFIITADEAGKETTSAKSIVPALYLGQGSSRAVVKAWQTDLLVGDVTYHYGLISTEIQAAWRAQVPGASTPDPIFRFLVAPSDSLITESFLFLKNTLGRHRPVTSVRNSTEPQPAGDCSPATSEMPQVKWDKVTSRVVIDGKSVDECPPGMTLACGLEVDALKRNVWIYEQCMKNVPYGNIVRQLAHHPEWDRIENPQGIQSCAARFAARVDLPKPARRRRGRCRIHDA